MTTPQPHSETLTDLKSSSFPVPSNHAQEFIDSVQEGLRYFQELATLPNDRAISELDEERENLYHLVQFGIRFSKTWPEAAVAILQTFPLVERRGYWQEWIPILHQALTYSAASDSELKVKLLNKLGQLHRLNRELMKAIAIHKEAEEVARTSGNELLEAQAQCNLMIDYEDNQQYSEAERYGLKALSTFEARKTEINWLSATLKILGRLAAERGDYNTAESRLNEVVVLWGSTGNKNELAKSYNDLGNILLKAGRFDEAHKHYRKALDFLESTPNELDKVLIYTNLGSLFFRQEKWEEAEMAFRHADSPYLRRSKHYYYQALTAHGLGNTKFKQGQYNDAAFYLEYAIKLWRSVDDKINLGNSIGTLGEVREAEGKTTAAILLYTEALQLLAQYPEIDRAIRLHQEFWTKRNALTNHRT